MEHDQLPRGNLLQIGYRLDRVDEPDRVRVVSGVEIVGRGADDERSIEARLYARSDNGKPATHAFSQYCDIASVQIFPGSDIVVAKQDIIDLGVLGRRVA